MPSVTDSYLMTYGGVTPDGWSDGDLLLDEGYWFGGGFGCISRAIDDWDGYIGITENYLNRSLIGTEESLRGIDEFYIDHSALKEKFSVSMYNQKSPTGRFSYSGYAIQVGVDPNTLISDLEADLSQLADAEGDPPASRSSAVRSGVYGGVRFGEHAGGRGLSIGKFKRGVLKQEGEGEFRACFHEDPESNLFLATLSKCISISNVKRHAISSSVEDDFAIYFHGGEQKLRIAALEKAVAELKEELPDTADTVWPGPIEVPDGL